MYTMIREQILPCTIDEAWKFFSNPYNLKDITPPVMHFEVLNKTGTEPIYEGMCIKYHVSPIFRIRFFWQTIITRVEKPHMFIDFQAKGPYRYWEHKHEFLANDQGVVMRDTIKYDLPGGFLGRVLHRFLVRKKLDDIFNYRGDSLKKIFKPEKI